MGKLLSTSKKTILDSIRTSIQANNIYYYAFAANPVSQTSVSNVSNDDYSTTFLNIWNLLIGKKLSNTNFLGVIDRVTWTTNTVYTRYDNTVDLSNSEFYVISEPSEVGGVYNLFKCIDNANGARSTDKPTQVQPTSFTTSDGYIWRYICSTSTVIKNRFSTDDYFPIYANTSLIESTYDYSGVEVIVISNSGSGYTTYANGRVEDIIVDTDLRTAVKISSDTEDSEGHTDLSFYNNCAVYFVNNNNPTTNQLAVITEHKSNSTGNWLIFDTSPNTTNITTTTLYRIAPHVKFDTDGDVDPIAYAVINTTSNSIGNVVIIENGYGITRANIQIVSGTGSGANLYAICPPPGGHGTDPLSELNMKGIGIQFQFYASESNTIPQNILYNKIGLLVNPYALTSNNTKGEAYIANTFEATLQANVTGSVTYSVGETITGNTSKAKGVVAFSNSTVLHMVGDKDFSNGEVVSNGSTQTTITINTLGDIYTKDIYPLYVQNIDNIQRANGQIEEFKIILQV